MIIVHDILVCKPGNASKLAKMFKEAFEGSSYPATRIMTDVTGQFNRVVMVSEFPDLAAFEKSFEEYINPSEEMKKVLKKTEGYTDMYLTGSREIYRVW